MNKIIKLLFILTILVWPFGLLLSYQTSYLPFPIYLLDILVVLLSILSFRATTRNPEGTSILFFYSIVLISLLFNYYRITLISLAYTTRLFAYPSIFFLTLKYNDLVKKYLPISLGIFIFLGLVQYFIFPDMRYLKLIGFDDHYFRLIGSFYDPNFSGAILATATIIFFAQSKYLLGSFSLISLALTFSRASYLSFGIGLFFYIFQSRKYRLLNFLAILALIIFLLPKPFGEGVNLLRTFSIYSRIDNWQENFGMFLQKPIFGWGYGTLGSIDSSPILVLASVGILGFLAFIATIYQVYKNLSLLGQAILIAILIHSLFNNSLFFIWIYFLFWTLLALETRGYKPLEE